MQSLSLIHFLPTSTLTFLLSFLYNYHLNLWPENPPLATTTCRALWRLSRFGMFPTHVLEEDAELWVGLRVDGGLEHGEENVLQHLAEVGHKVPASEDITEIEEGQRKQASQAF